MIQLVPTPIYWFCVIVIFIMLSYDILRNCYLIRIIKTFLIWWKVQACTSTAAFWGIASNTVIIKITTNNYYLIFSKTLTYMLISLNACIVYLSIIITRGCCILFSSLAYPLNAISVKRSTSHVLCLKRYLVFMCLALSNYNLISWWRMFKEWWF